MFEAKDLVNDDYLTVFFSLIETSTTGDSLSEILNKLIVSE
jgi:hypothetical protein